MIVSLGGSQADNYEWLTKLIFKEIAGGNGYVSDQIRACFIFPKKIPNQKLG